MEKAEFTFKVSRYVITVFINELKDGWSASIWVNSKFYTEINPTEKLYTLSWCKDAVVDRLENFFLSVKDPKAYTSFKNLVLFFKF